MCENDPNNFRDLPIPTTEQVRNMYAYVGQGFAPSARKSRAEAEAEFDRWLAQRGLLHRPEPLGSFQDGVFTPASGPMADGSNDA